MTDAPRSLVELRAKIERDGCGQFGPSTVDIDEAFALYDERIAALEREVAELKMRKDGDANTPGTVLDSRHRNDNAKPQAEHVVTPEALTLARAQVREQAARVDDALIDACAETLAAKFRVVWEDLPPFYTSEPHMKQAFSKHDFRTWARVVLEKAAAIRAMPLEV